MAGVPPRPGVRPGPQDQLTREDLKGLRRWVIVAAVWAVAATSIALIALLDASDSDARKEADRTADRVAALERKLDARLDALEAKVEDLPGSEDLSKLEERLSNAERDASRAAGDSKSSREAATELEDRVKALEDAADTTDTDTDTP